MTTPPPEAQATGIVQSEEVDFSEIQEGSQIHGLTIEKIYFLNETVDPKYLVFRDDQNSVHWITFQNKNSLTLEQLALLSKAELLLAVPRNEFSPEQQSNALSMIGQTMVNTLANNLALAQELLTLAEKFITNRRLEFGRVNYCYAAFAAFGIAAVCGLIGAFYNGAASEIPTFMAAGAMGSVGAFAFAIWRWKERELDPDSGKRMHWLDGGIRVLMGAMAGFIVMMLFHSNMDLVVVKMESLSAVKGKTGGLYAAFIFCFISGWSERWIPNLVEKLENPKSSES